MNIGISGICSKATAHLLDDAVRLWARHDGVEIRFESVGGLDAERRIRGGESFDLMVLAADAIQRLEAAGLVLAGTTTALARSSVAIAVRDGAVRPRVATDGELRQAVRMARSVGYSTGPSGQALQRLFARWGITDEIESRVVQASPGVPVGELVACGEVELGFQQLSELIHVKGIDVIGPMPPGLEIDTVFCGATGAGSRHPDAARALLDFIASAALDQCRARHGLHCARTSSG